MSDRIYYDILTSARSLVAQLGLTGLPPDPTEPTTGGNVAVRKLPGPADKLDIRPMITLCPTEQGETERPNGFGSKEVIYPVQFTIVWDGNKDLVTNLDQILEWRQQIRDLFYLPAAMKALVPSIWNTEFLANAPIDRAKVSKNYDYSAFVIKFKSIETVPHVDAAPPTPSTPVGPAVVAFLDPAAYAFSGFEDTVHTTYVDMSLFERAVFILKLGATDTTVDFKLRAAQQSNGTGEIDMPGKLIVPFAATDDGKIAEIHVSASELTDMGVDYRYVRARLVVGPGDSTLLSVVALGFPQDYDLPSVGNIPQVAQIIQ